MICRRCSIVALISFLLLCCGACEAENNSVEDLEKFFYDAEFNYTEQMGKTAVLTEKTSLLNPYTYTYGDPEDYSTYDWVVLNLEYSFRAGDVVLILSEAEEMSRVVVPYGDIPWIYGYVPSSLLSTDLYNIKDGNQAILDECAIYDTVDGAVIEIISGKAEIQFSDDEWSEIKKSVGGDDVVYWVHSEDLSFEFDTLVLDIPS